MQLDTITILTELFRIGFIFVGCLLFVKFILTFIKTKKEQRTINEELILLGFAWLFFSIAYLGGMLSFISIILFDDPIHLYRIFNVDPLLVFTILNVNLAPIITFLWFYTVFKVIQKRGSETLKSISTLVLGILCLIFEFVVFYIEAIGNLSLLGSMQNPFEYEYSDPLKIVVLICLLLTLGVGFYFAYNTWRSDELKIKLKGKYLLWAFIMLIGSTIMDAVIAVIDPIFSMIAKLLLIFSGLLFYIGFFLPEWWIIKFHPKLKVKL